MELPKMGTHKLVLDSVAARMKKEKPRDYMGASSLGIECDRQLWYNYHQPRPVGNPKTQMIFDLGNILEDYVIKLLRDAGLKVWDKDENGEQFGFVEEEVAGHVDGVIEGLPESKVAHLLEIKTANDKRFAEMVKKGCKVSNKSYWIQCQVYMHKLGLTRCLFVVINKNNCELYFERIEVSGTAGDSAIMRGKEIARTTEKPRQKYKSSTFFKCRFCNYNKECWDEKENKEKSNEEKSS